MVRYMVLYETDYGGHMVLYETQIMVGHMVLYEADYGGTHDRAAQHIDEYMM